MKHFGDGLEVAERGWLLLHVHHGVLHPQMTQRLEELRFLSLCIAHEAWLKVIVVYSFEPEPNKRYLVPTGETHTQKRPPLQCPERET